MSAGVVLTRDRSKFSSAVIARAIDSWISRILDVGIVASW